MNLKEKRTFQSQTDEQLRRVMEHEPSKKLKRLAKAELIRRNALVTK